jgi:hypothetical protein
MLVDADNKLEFYRSDRYDQISDEAMKKVEEARAKMDKEYKKRRRICRDGVGQIADGMEKKVIDVMEMIGIEDLD